MAQCITCGSELHPDRAEKYDYCMAPECQRKNLKGLDLVAIGVNKSAEQYLLLDQQTRDELASGKFADQRRGSFGTSLPSVPGPATPAVPGPATPAVPGPATPAAPGPATPAAPGRAAPARPAPRRPARPRPAAPPAPRKAWTRSQEKLALLYNEQGQRPDEIARKLGLSTYLVTQIILTSRNRGKL
jgi:hypothetical protein